MRNMIFIWTRSLFFFRVHLVKFAEDFIEMADSLTETNEAIFLRHVSLRSLTLSPYFEAVLKRWEDCHKYFLTFAKKNIGIIAERI